MRGPRFDVTFVTKLDSTTDAEGRTTFTTSTSTLHTVAALASSRAGEAGGYGVETGAGLQRGESHDAVVLVPLDYVVTREQECSIDAPVPLGGSYRVTTIRYTHRHKRVLLSRNEP